MCVLLGQLVGVCKGLLPPISELHTRCHVGVRAFKGWRLLWSRGSCPVHFLVPIAGILAVRFFQRRSLKYGIKLVELKGRWW